MPALWAKAPLLLFRHLPVLAAVVLTTALAALASSAPPLVRAGVESESLRAQLRSMSPLAAGLEIVADGVHIDGERARRAAAVRLRETVPFLGPPVMSALVPAQVAGSAAPGTEVVAVARTNAVDHVRHVAGNAGDDGAWIADTTAHVTHLRPGDTLRLTEHVSAGRFNIVAVRVAGIYRALEGDRNNPYWANWLQDIRTNDPDADVPPTFVLLSERDLERVSRALSPVVQDRFELPVDPRGITYASASGLDRRLDALRTSLPGSRVGRALDCRTDNCRTTSSLSAALRVAASDVAAVTPTISLLSAIGLAIALGLSVAAGLFLVRRRSDEAHVLFARGESPVSFGARTALEAALPAAAGLVLGAGVALLALRTLAPAGTITGGSAWGAVARGALGVLAAVGCVVAGALGGFPRVGNAHVVRLRHVPWEVLPLGTAAVLFALVLGGHGLAHDVNGASHPRLAVFLVPIVAVVGIAGLAVRAARSLLAGRGSGARPVVFLALRRIAAARGLLVAVIVAAATAFGTFAYAATLSASLHRSTAEKAYVSNGSDVQGLVDPTNRIITPYPFPVALVEVDQSNMSLPSGERVDVIAGDPTQLERTLRWGPWNDDPRRLLPRLRAPGLPAIATPGTPATDAIFDQGVRIPIRIVGHAPIPGSTAGRPALLVPLAAFRRAVARAHVLEPGPQASGFLWAKGDPARLLPVLERSNLAPIYLTTLDHIEDDASVSAAERSYRYVRIIGLAAAMLALVALLLYLQARQRGQLIASALVRRMGVGATADAAALALEASAVIAFAALVGGVAATAAALPIAKRVDSLPQYAPAPVFTVPWTTLLAGGACAIVVAALLGVVAAVLAGRSDAAEALRVA